MNPEAQAFLDEILKKKPENLNPDEIEFLAGRRDYLKKAQLEEFEDVLKKRDNQITKQNQTSEKSETVKEHGKPQKTN